MTYWEVDNSKSIKAWKDAWEELCMKLVDKYMKQDPIQNQNIRLLILLKKMVIGIGFFLENIFLNIL